MTNLLNFDALVFLHNSDEILDSDGKDNLFSYLTSGGNLIGIHSATAALFNTSFYGKAFGAFFDYHPDLQPATFIPLNVSHPSTASLPARWTFTEEVYYFRSNPRDNDVTVIMSVDPASYNDTTTHTAAQEDQIQGTPHPIAWFRDGNQQGLDLVNTNGNEGTFKGRMWYTSLGHEISTWQNQTYQNHILNGIQWVLNSTTKAVISTPGLTNPGSGGGQGSSGSGASSDRPVTITSLPLQAAALIVAGAAALV
ncbi:class I glutamine amidotransferase-like protein [Atractiella rhizophila]|nr:class I glutamine amidotransferase-like protein [Atractiella rhizophila]